MYPYLTLCWPHLPRVIWDGPECPLVPLLPDLPAGWHCFFVVAGLAQRETLGTEPSASDPCAGLEWILSRCLLRDEETVIDRDSDPHIGEVRVMCSSLSLPQWLHLSRAKRQRPCREPQGPVHSGPRPDPIACLLFLGLAPITSVCFSPIKHTRHLLIPNYQTPLHPGISMAPCSFLWGSPQWPSTSKTSLYWCLPSSSPLFPDSYHSLKPGYRPESLHACCLSCWRPGISYVPG